MEGIDKRVRSTNAGEYWRLLSPGRYTLRATAKGYRPSQPTSVTVGSSWPPTAQQVLFTLEPHRAQTNTFNPSGGNGFVNPAVSGFGPGQPLFPVQLQG